MAFYKALVVTGAAIWPNVFLWQPFWILRKQVTRGQADLVCDGFLKTLCPYLTLCQVTKTSQQVHDSTGYDDIPPKV